jgi:Fe-S cluster assembly protein SufD
MNTKPQLEIFADDVKCTHGATIGQLDDEQIFYLRSRGIGLDAARDILTSAFASDVINRITMEPLRQHVERMIHDRLNKNHTSNERA